MTLLRYPGSKEKIAEQIVREFPLDFTMPILQRRGLEYREPFLGGGAIACRVLKMLPNDATVWLNEKDYSLCCLWKAVRDVPKELIAKIQRMTPSPDGFYKLKEEDGDQSVDIAIAGARKLALHQWSFSGLGYMAGGPIGGRKQSSEYNVDCRWSPLRIEKAVMRVHKLMARFQRRVEITCRDFSDVINGAPSGSFIYADPPYYEKGPELYRHSMTDDDHRRLAECLRASRAAFVLSYDDHEFVRGLYEPWARIKAVHLTYTTAVAKNGIRRKNSEVLISSPVAQTEAA